MDPIEVVWLYSHYYGDMLFTAQRLFQINEGYAAVSMLLNATELIFKSMRDKFNQTFNQDLAALCEDGIIDNEEWSLFNQEGSGIRAIRNIMTHKNAYMYCFESPDGKALPFTEADTWMTIYSNYAPAIFATLGNAIQRYNKKIWEIN